MAPRLRPTFNFPFLFNRPASVYLIEGNTFTVPPPSWLVRRPASDVCRDPPLPPCAWGRAHTLNYFLRPFYFLVPVNFTSGRPTPSSPT